MGKVEIDHTGSGGGITLSSDGTDLLLDGTAIGGGGGGGADLYAANESSPSAQPSATGTNAIAIGDSAVASGSNAVAFGQYATSAGTRSVSIGHSYASGTDSFAAGIAASVNSFGAIGNYSAAIGYRAKTTATDALAIGQNALASGSRSTAISKSYTSGNDSFAAAITNNTSSYGATGISSIAGGYLNKASSSDSLCWGGDSNIASNGQATVIGGWLNQAQGGYSFVGGGRNNRALASYSRAGGHDADTNDNHGKDVWASGDFSSRGDAQTAKRVLRSDTTDATPEVLSSINGSPNTTNQIVLPNNSCYGFTGTVIARENSAQTNDFAVWEIKGGAVRAGSASTTALGSYNINKISESTGAANWSIALSADTTNGAVAITVTGEASHSIRWVATVNTTEVTY